MDELTKWKLAGIAVSIASLFWNLFNSWYARVLTDAARKDGIKLDEFRTQVRQPITSALKKFQSFTTTLRSFSIGQSERDTLKEKLNDLYQEMTKAFIELEDALRNANASKFAEGHDWVDQFEDVQEKCNDLMDMLIRLSDKEQQASKEHVAGICDCLSEYKKQLSEKMEAVTEGFVK